MNKGTIIPITGTILSFVNLVISISDDVTEWPVRPVYAVIISIVLLIPAIVWLWVRFVVQPMNTLGKKWRLRKKGLLKGLFMLGGRPNVALRLKTIQVLADRLCILP